MWNEEVKMVVKMERNESLDKRAGIEASKYPQSGRLRLDCVCMYKRICGPVLPPDGRPPGLARVRAGRQWTMEAMDNQWAVRGPLLPRLLAHPPFGTASHCHSGTKKRTHHAHITSGQTIVLRDRHGIIGYHAQWSMPRRPWAPEEQSIHPPGHQVDPGPAQRVADSNLGWNSCWRREVKVSDQWAAEATTGPECKRGGRSLENGLCRPINRCRLLKTRRIWNEARG